MDGSAGIRLEFADGRPELNTVDEINRCLEPIGVGVWPLDFRQVPPEVLQLLSNTSLTYEQTETIQQQFLLPREQLLEAVRRAGRNPHVPDGGALSTYVVSHDYSYPQLYVADEDGDYSRFDRFHVNVADDGTGTDEVLQMLAGGGLILHHPLPDGVVTWLHLDCVAEGMGWICTYDGARPHIGQLSQAIPGTKLLVQVIGAERWSMSYDLDA